MSRIGSVAFEGMVRARNIFPLTIYQSEVNDNPPLKELFLPSIEESLPYLTIPEDWATDNLKTSYGNQNKVLSGKVFFTRKIL